MLNSSNFVGAETELDAAVSELDEKKVEKFVTECGWKWEFKPSPCITFWRCVGEAC